MLKTLLISCSLVLAIVLASCTLHAQTVPVMTHERYASFLEENKGKVVVVDFWATWCGPCRKKLPELQKCRRSFSQEQLTLIGISLDFNPETLNVYLETNPLNYPVFWADEHLGAQLGVQAIPLLHIYDVEGRLQIVEEGLTPHETLCQNIDLFTELP